MINSIQQFHEEGVKRSTKVFTEYTSDRTKIAEMVYWNRKLYPNYRGFIGTSSGRSC